MSIDLDDIRKVVKDLETEKNQAICDNQDLNDELSHLKEELCQLQHINDKLCDDLECADRTVKKLKCDNCRLEDCVRQKEQEICCLRKLCDENEKLKSYICQLEKDLDCANKQICKLEEQVVDLERCLQEKELCIRRLENRLAELENEVCELENTVKYLTNENECLKQELEECRCNLQKANQELECLCSKLKLCECAKQKLQDQVACLQSALDQAHEALQKEKACNCKLQNQIKNCQEENYKLKMENSCLCEENCDLSKKLDCVSKNLKKCQCEFERAQQECCELRKCIEQFKRQILTGIKCSAPPDCCSNTKYMSRARSVNFPSRMTMKNNRTRGDCCDYTSSPCRKTDCITSITSFPRCDIKSGANKGCGGGNISSVKANTTCCPAPRTARSRKCNDNCSPTKKYCKSNKKCF